MPARAGAVIRSVALVVALALVGAIVAVVVAQRGADTYVATSQVGFSRPTVPTQATLAQTRAIAADASRRSGVRHMSARKLMAATEVEVAPTPTPSSSTSATRPAGGARPGRCLRRRVRRGAQGALHRGRIAAAHAPSR
jgi:hypothetical protein